MVRRIDHLVAVLEPAKRVEDNLVHLNSVLGIRFRHYVKYMNLLHEILSEIKKSADLSRKKYDKKKDFDVTPKHFIHAIDYIKKSRVLLSEILDVVRLIYDDESKAYSVDNILDKHLVEIKNNVGEWGNTTHPLLSDLEGFDKAIVSCRQEISSSSFDIKKIYGSVKEIYEVLKKEEALMDSFYSKVQDRFEHFKRYYDHMPTGGFSGFNWQEKEGLLKEFEELQKDYDKRFGDLERIKSQELAVINSIYRSVKKDERVHNKIMNSAVQIKSLLRERYSAKTKLFF